MSHSVADISWHDMGYLENFKGKYLKIFALYSFLCMEVRIVIIFYYYLRIYVVGFIQSLGYINFDGSFNRAHTEADPFGDFALALEYDLSFLSSEVCDILMNIFCELLL